MNSLLKVQKKMNSQEYLDIMKGIQESILYFLEDEANSEENFLILENKFKDIKISENRYELLSLLHLILKISNNHYRFPNFFSKIERILLKFKKEITKYFSNFEIFNIFKSNKRLLLFLSEQKIIIFDSNITKKVISSSKFREAKYHLYFQPEIRPFINERLLSKYECLEDLTEDLPANFHENRKKGENENQICELIRNDKIIEFDAYVKQNDISLNMTIQPSIYETNLFLIKNQSKFHKIQKSEENENETEICGLSLIEYAAFFGSIQIFNHLRLGGVEMKSSLWSLAIHGKSAEIIHLLEDNNIDSEFESHEKYFYESVKCHHNDIANHFLKKSPQDDFENSQNTFNQCAKYYNFAFMKNEFINQSSFCSLCKNDYCTLVDYLLKSKEIDINRKEILKFMRFYLIS